MEIRTAVLDDSEQIADIHATSWRNTYHGVLTEHYLKDVAPAERVEVWRERLIAPKYNQHIIVAEENRLIVGFACVYLSENPVWGSYLENLHVREVYQGRGIGAALLSEVAHHCLKHDAKKGLCLLVNQDNIQAQDFYLRFGARNAQEGVWNAPDNSIVPTFWFVWDTLDHFLNSD